MGTTLQPDLVSDAAGPWRANDPDGLEQSLEQLPRTADAQACFRRFEGDPGA